MTEARTAGKSTLAREITARYGGSFVDLDVPAVRQLAAADPTSFVHERPEPVVIDEFQRVPELLSAIMAELNQDRRPGRFVLAGSARHEAVPQVADYLTGRVTLVPLWPFAVAEVVKQLGWSSIAARPHHFRTADGIEVDLVLEAPDGRIVAIEVKAAPGLSSGTTRGLAHLRDRLGDRFVAGLVLDTGGDAQAIGDRLSVAPVSALWS